MGIFGGRSDGSADDGGLGRRVEELERRVAALEWALRSSGVAPAPSPGDAVSAEVRQLALRGKKINAIKLLREQTGLGLAEAKDVVDRLAP